MVMKVNAHAPRVKHTGARAPTRVVHYGSFWTLAFKCTVAINFPKTFPCIFRICCDISHSLTPAPCPLGGGGGGLRVKLN